VWGNSTRSVSTGFSTGLGGGLAGGGGRVQAERVESEQSMRWRALLQAQSGIVARRQALDAGWPERTIDRRLRSGAWRRIDRGVYATFTGELSRNARLWAAVLRAGPGAVLSHETAAEVHGLASKPSSRIHLSVPISRAPAGRIRGVVIHRCRGLNPEWLPPWQLPRTSVEDTVLDLIGAARNYDDAYGWISAAVGRRLTTPELLAKALAGRPRMRWRPWVAGALQDAAGHPPGQREPADGHADAAVWLARRHRTPMPDCQPGRGGAAAAWLGWEPAALRPGVHGRCHR